MICFTCLSASLDQKLHEACSTHGYPPKARVQKFKPKCYVYYPIGQTKSCARTPHQWDKENTSSPNGGTAKSHNKWYNRMWNEDWRKIMECIRIICMYYIEIKQRPCVCHLRIYCILPELGISNFEKY